MNKKAVLGLSDGVDSAVAAKVLKDQGYDVSGVYLDIAGDKQRADAIKSAERLSIELTIVDITDRLNKFVCEPFLKAYLSGETPSPCIGCNRDVKLPALLERADEIGADWVATGHYSRVIGGAVYTGFPDNDQSYMLAFLTRTQIGRLLLPLGGFQKSDVRKMALEMGLEVANKPDSREICFVPDKDYQAWIQKRAAVPGEGDAVYRGQRLFAHEGIHRYTVGQRFGETEEGRRLYVSGIDADTNTIHLEKWEALFKDDFYVRDIYWQDECDRDEIRAIVRCRHTRWEMPRCTVKKEGGRWHVFVDSPVRAPAKGQIAAFYAGEKLLGGGVIDG